MRVRVDKETIVRLYCYSREAERSVHRSLDADWSEFRDYYGSSKRDAIRDCLEISKSRFPALALLGPAATSAEIGRLLPERSLFQFFFARWLSKKKQAWNFDIRELHFIVSVWDALLKLLERSVKPEAATLISLRMDMFACRYIIECRCYGLEQVNPDQAFEHFHQTQWLPTVKVADIIGELHADKGQFRKSA